MKNTVTLVGFVGNDSEVRETKSDATLVNLSLATTRSFKDSEGERQQETEWHRITCFNGIGKCVADHVTKGAMIMVTGRIHYTKWTDKESAFQMPETWKDKSCAREVHLPAQDSPDFPI